MKIKKKTKKKTSHFIKKNAGTARASNGLDMLTWCSFHIYFAPDRKNMTYNFIKVVI